MLRAPVEQLSATPQTCPEGPSPQPSAGNVHTAPCSPAGSCPRGGMMGVWPDCGCGQCWWACPGVWPVITGGGHGRQWVWPVLVWCPGGVVPGGVVPSQGVPAHCMIRGVPGLQVRARAAPGTSALLRGRHERPERLGEHGTAHLRPLQPGQRECAGQGAVGDGGGASWLALCPAGPGGKGHPEPSAPRSRLVQHPDASAPLVFARCETCWEFRPGVSECVPTKSAPRTPWHTGSSTSCPWGPRIGGGNSLGMIGHAISARCPG